MGIVGLWRMDALYCTYHGCSFYFTALCVPHFKVLELYFTTKIQAETVHAHFLKIGKFD